MKTGAVPAVLPGHSPVRTKWADNKRETGIPARNGAGKPRLPSENVQFHFGRYAFSSSALRLKSRNKVQGITGAARHPYAAEGGWCAGNRRVSRVWKDGKAGGEGDVSAGVIIV
jgi:hypothetical protein